MKTIKAELGTTYTIIGRQRGTVPGKFRNRYAGVNDRGGACVLTMGELRTFRCRVYFNDYEMARNFYEMFVEKFGHRENTKFELKKVTGNNPIIGHELVLDKSDCGPYYHASQIIYNGGQNAPWSAYRDKDLELDNKGAHGIRPTSTGKVSWERDGYKRESMEDFTFDCKQSEDHEGDCDLTITDYD